MHAGGARDTGNGNQASGAAMPGSANRLLDCDTTTTDGDSIGAYLALIAERNAWRGIADAAMLHVRSLNGQLEELERIDRARS